MSIIAIECKWCGGVGCLYCPEELWAQRRARVANFSHYEAQRIEAAAADTERAVQRTVHLWPEVLDRCWRVYEKKGGV